MRRLGKMADEVHGRIDALEERLSSLRRGL